MFVCLRKSFYFISKGLVKGLSIFIVSGNKGREKSREKKEELYFQNTSLCIHKY